VVSGHVEILSGTQDSISSTQPSSQMADWLDAVSPLLNFSWNSTANFLNVGMKDKPDEMSA